LQSCCLVRREPLPYAGYGRSGARPIRWSRSPESLSEFSVPLLPITPVREPIRCVSWINFSFLSAAKQTRSRSVAPRDFCPTWAPGFCLSDLDRLPRRRGRPTSSMSAIYAPVSRPTTCINVGDIIIDVASTLVRGIETDLNPREFELADGFRRSISKAIETRVFPNSTSWLCRLSLPREAPSKSTGRCDQYHPHQCTLDMRTRAD
jgi:hypothetical protein